ncbi:hypothetical protein WPS_15270 [Vulcanimicrobium alpinum]|uniref:Cytochrome c domain-containing protein n=1 Tax=Vulcanimicrobium alpinum TaxID=3016050 RepID=A0AAN2C9P7_UNVUL|nr:cytochrome c [Vulcanimicrobium alpinum]BDE06251.1 hypothetical protein WPS_15270 [Vulcanimicrobium alpinum]
MQLKSFTVLASVAMCSFLAVGCSKGSDQSSQSTTTTTTSTTAPASQSGSNASSASAATGDAGHGKTIFTANCAQCHGASGIEGGVGPSLKDEKSRKNYEQAVAWIKNPKPPMPKLYPSPLSEKDVDDVAAYVESL